VNTSVHVVCPRTLQKAEITNDRYWLEPFTPMANAKNLKEYVVVDMSTADVPKKPNRVMYKSQKSREREAAGRAAGAARAELGGAGAGAALPGDGHKGGAKLAKQAGAVAGSSIGPNNGRALPNHNPNAKRWVLCDIECARASDMGTNDTRFLTRSHLGRLAEAGNAMMGYDLTSAVFNDNSLTERNMREIPEVVLVRKHYPFWRKEIGRVGVRHWKLASMDVAADQGSVAASGEVEMGESKADGNSAGTGGRRTRGRKKKEKRAKGERGARGMQQTSGATRATEEDREMFMRDLEEDPEMREQVNIYRNEKFDFSTTDAAGTVQGGLTAVAAANAEANEAENEDVVAPEDLEQDFPVIELNELLDSMGGLSLGGERGVGGLGLLVGGGGGRGGGGQISGGVDAADLDAAPIVDGRGNVVCEGGEGSAMQ
jgi:hypothetical protein